MSEVNDQIREMVTSNDVVLYMKGTKEMPQCGFSSRVAGVLNYIGVEYQDVNVLADENVRQGIKDYSDWPTVPQLYVKGEFVGGCDIVTEMALSGELDTLFRDNGVNFSEEAAEKNTRSKQIAEYISENEQSANGALVQTHISSVVSQFCPQVFLPFRQYQ